MTLRTLLVVALGVTVQVVHAEDSLDRRLKAIVHQGTDCGRVGQGGSPRSVVIACVTKEFTANRPFRARVDGCGEDSCGGLGLALEDRGGDRGGQFYVIDFDNIACGGAKAADPYCGTVVRQCDRPRLVPEGDHLKVTCRNEYTF